MWVVSGAGEAGGSGGGDRRGEGEAVGAEGRDGGGEVGEEKKSTNRERGGARKTVAARTSLPGLNFSGRHKSFESGTVAVEGPID